MLQFQSFRARLFYEIKVFTFEQEMPLTQVRDFEPDRLLTADRRFDEPRNHLCASSFLLVGTQHDGHDRKAPRWRYGSGELKVPSNRGALSNCSHSHE